MSISLLSIRNSIPSAQGTLSFSQIQGMIPYVPASGAFSMSRYKYFDDTGFSTIFPIGAARVLGNTSTFSAVKSGTHPAISLSFWCYMNTTTFDANEGPISIDDGTTAFVIDLESNNATALPNLWGTIPGGAFTQPWPSKQWIFVSFVFNQTSMVCQVFNASGSTIASSATMPFSSRSLNDITTTFAYLPRYPGHEQSYYMYVYDFRQYNSALSNSELFQLRDNGKIAGKSPVSMIACDGIVSEKRVGGQTITSIGTGLTYKSYRQVIIDGS